MNGRLMELWKLSEDKKYTGEDTQVLRNELTSLN